LVLEREVPHDGGVILGVAVVAQTILLGASRVSGVLLRLRLFRLGSFLNDFPVQIQVLHTFILYHGLQIKLFIEGGLVQLCGSKFGSIGSY
jgi:hypothetical protein